MRNSFRPRDTQESHKKDKTESDAKYAKDPLIKKKKTTTKQSQPNIMRQRTSTDATEWLLCWSSTAGHGDCI